MELEEARELERRRELEIEEEREMERLHYEEEQRREIQRQQEEMEELERHRASRETLDSVDNSFVHNEHVSSTPRKPERTNKRGIYSCSELVTNFKVKRHK